MKSCPNPNSPEFKSLVEEISNKNNLNKKDSTTVAYGIFDKVGGEIPSTLPNEVFSIDETITSVLDNFVDLNDFSFDPKDISFSLEDFNFSPLKIKENNKFIIIRKAIENQLKSSYKELGNLRDKRRIAKTANDIKNLNHQIVELASHIEKLTSDLEDAKSLTQVDELRAFGDQAVERVKDLLSKDKMTVSEIEECQRLIELWQNIGNFSPSIGKEGHPIFTNEELKDDKIRLGFTDEAGEYHRGIPEYKAEMDKLALSVNKRAADLVVNFVYSTIGHTYITKEDIFKAIQDIGFIKSQTLDLSKVNDPMVQALAKAMYKANSAARVESEELISSLENLFKKANKFLKEHPDIFIQTYQDGSKTGNLVFRFTPEYQDLINAKKREAYSNNNLKGWRDYYNWVTKNCIYIDVRKLYNQDTGELLNTAEASQYILELEKKLGAKTVQYYLERQTKLIQDYIELRDTKRELLEGPEEEVNTNMKLWEQLHSPFKELDMILDDKGFKTMLVKHKYPRRSFTQFVPKRINDQGQSTNFYDSKFEIIESNEDALNLYNQILNTLQELRYLIPEAQRRNIQINSLPTIQDAALAQFLKGPLKLGAAPIYDLFKKLTLTTDSSPIITEEVDIKTGRVKSTLTPNFFTDNSAKIKQYIQEKTIEYKNQFKENPSLEIKAQWRKEIEKELAQNKSYDLEKILKLYIAQALSYKHKASIEGIINLTRNAFTSRAVTVTNFTGQKLVDQYGNPQLDTSGASNIAELIDYTIDVFYNKPRHAAGTKISKKIYTSEEKKRKEELSKLLQENEENFQNKTISQQEYEQTKANLEIEIAKLGRFLTTSSLADSALKFNQLLVMGYNGLSGITNLLTGGFENLTLAADGRLFTSKQLFSSYFEVLQTVLGKNLSSSLGKKIIAIDKKFDVTQQAVNELYKRPGFFSKLKVFNPFAISEKTEFINQMATITAYLKNKKAIDPEGNQVSVFEALDEEANVKKGYILDSTKSNESALLDLEYNIAQLIKETHGNYNSNLPVAMKKTAMGRLLSQFRSWMPEMYAKRFGAEMHNYALGITTKGRYITLKDIFQTKTAEGEAYGSWNMLLWTIKQLLRKSFFFSTKFNDRLNEVDAANMRALLTEIQLVGALFILSIILRGMAEDDDDKKQSLFALLNMVNRFNSDILLYANPLSFESISKNILPISNLLTLGSNLTDSAINFITEADDESYERFIRNTIKATPLLNQGLRIATYGDKEF